MAPLALPERFVAAAAALKDKLEAAFPDSAADERILYDLVGGEFALLHALNEATASAAVGLLDAATNVKQQGERAQLVRELILAGASLSGRIRTALGTASTLRVHREIARRHRREGGSL